MAQRGEPLLWLQEHKNYTGESCLIWPFGRRKDGYAWIRFRGVAQTAARVICILSQGEPPSNKHHAAHFCGNGHLGCVNPSHLRWATASENCADKQLHGTLARGVKCSKSTLCEHDILLIRLLDGRLKRREIGKQFNISRQAVNDIVWGTSWGWL